MQVSVKIDTATRPANAVGILFPKPFDRPSQSFDGFVGMDKRARLCSAEGYGPESYLIEDVPSDFTIQMAYKYGTGKVPRTVFDKVYQAKLDTGEEPSSPGVWLPEMPTGPTAESRTEQVINAVGNRFRYGARNPNIATEATSCDLLTGNCIDINRVLLRALKDADVPAAYIAGYYFANSNLPADGMHCWIATITESGYQEWDVAHALQAGATRIEPHTGDKNGTRVAVSHGRDLTYKVHGQAFEFDHFVQPHWLLENGGTTMAQYTAVMSLKRVPQPSLSPTF